MIDSSTTMPRAAKAGASVSPEAAFMRYPGEIEAELKHLTDARREARKAKDLDRITVLTAAINSKLDAMNREKQARVTTAAARAGTAAKAGQT